MFVVKRPFKSVGKIYTAGTVITEPADIKRFKGKLAEGKIVEVTEQTFEVSAKYFKDKYGVDITPAKKPTDKPVTQSEATPKTVSKPVSKPVTASK